MEKDREEIISRREKLSTAKQALLEKRLRGELKTDSKLEIIPRRVEKSPAPLSFAQQRLWFLHQLDPANSSYNEFSSIHLIGSLDVAALTQSFNEIIRRHETLRTTFAIASGQPVQIIAPSGAIALPVINLRELSETERQAEVQKLCVEEAQKPFDLTSGPLLRGTLLEMSDRDRWLLFSIHHIASDGWSIRVLIRELAALYEAFRTGKFSPLPELDIQYADFAIWQRQWLSGGAQQTQLAYWKQQLAGVPPVLDLPTDKPRPPVQSTRGAIASFQLSANLSSRLKSLSHKFGVTLFITLLAAFQTQLYRYTNAEDIAVGSAIANRHRAEIEGLIGFFVNTLVLRTRLDGNPSFQELLDRVREVCLGAYSHQDLPFEKLVEELHPERNLSHTPLFQVMFVLQEDYAEDLKLPDLTLKQQLIHSGTAKFDLTLYVIDSEPELRGWIEYNTDLFEASTIARTIEHFHNLLEGILSNPQAKISDLPLLTSSELKQLLIECNNTDKIYPNGCIHEFFEAQVRLTPDAIAVVFEGEKLTYSELNAKANQLGHYLRSLGVEADVLVGICAERSLEMVIGLLGILKAGGAYVPIDPNYPQERIKFILKDASISLLLTQQHLLEKIPTIRTHTICLDADWHEIFLHSSDNLVNNNAPENLAYVIYTSGSTGQPKGAMNVHKAIANRLLWMQDAYQLTAADRVLQKTPFSFDVSVWEFFWPLIVGARLVLAKPGGHLDSSYLVELLAKEQITTLHFVPSMLQIFLEEKSLEARTSIKRVICSGEALSGELRNRFFQRLDAELHNLYGPTEAAIDVTFFECDRSDNSAIVPIGRAIANTQIYLLDPHLNPVPIGIPGELHIGGVNLARGYLNRPELTAEKFIDNPLKAEISKSERLYKTGDLARYLPDGNIEYLGRIDHQVKLRGFRIELGEIEAVLTQHPAVRESLVLAREDKPGDKKLVAYIVGDRAPTPDLGELRNYLKAQLPEYMVPSSFVLIDALPLTTNGKIDRRALPAPEQPVLSATYEAPQTEIESIIANIWQEVLHLEKVGIRDNFFEIGGHSLLAVQVRVKMQEALNRDISVLEIFERPTINLLAKYLSQESEILSDWRAVDERVQKQRQAAARNKKLLKKGVSSDE